MKTIIGNWKMNLGVRESVALARAGLLLLRGRKIAPHLVMCPSFVALSEVRKVVAHSTVGLGAQTVHAEDQGAFTGETSARMLTELGVSYVLLGHSERRALAHETDEEINKKVLQALAHQITPVLCVGETREQHAAGETRTVVTHQLTDALKHVRLKSTDRLVIAYEPVWAIGTGETPTVEEVVEIHTRIRDVLEMIFPSAPRDQISVLYGGSVSGENAYQFLREPAIDGVLVGSASIKIHHLKEIVEAAVQVLEAQSSL